MAKVLDDILVVENGGQILIGDGAIGVNFSGIRVRKSGDGSIYRLETFYQDELQLYIGEDGRLHSNDESFIIGPTGATGTFEGKVIASSESVISGTSIISGTVVARTLAESSRAATTDIVFSSPDYQTVNWTSGSLKLADGTSYAISSGSTGAMTAATYIYFDRVASASQLQVSTNFGVLASDTAILICNAKPAGTTDLLAHFVSINDHMLLNVNQLNVNYLSALSADMGDLTSGTITLSSTGHIKSGQSAYDVGIGFWMGKDGATTKLSLGNAAGDKLTWNGSLLDVTGAITVTGGNAAKTDLSNVLLNAVADKVNTDTTLIQPGRILVSGTTTLSDWRATASQTLIDGGKIYAGSEVIVGTGNNIAALSGANATYRLWIGHADPEQAPLNVTQAGVITAIGGIFKSAGSGTRVEISSTGSYPHKVAFFNDSGSFVGQISPLSNGLGIEGNTHTTITAGELRTGVVKVANATANPTTQADGLWLGGATANNPDTGIYRAAANVVATDDQFKVTVVGVPPFIVFSTNVVGNLNAEYLNGYIPANFALAIHTHAKGDITGLPWAVSEGGTGANTFPAGYLKASGTSPFSTVASISGSDVSGNIAGNAANVTVTVAVSNGGTGLTTLGAAGALFFSTSASALATLGIGASGYILTSSGTAPQWSAGLDASKITSGTFGDARIAQSNVTQHQTALSIAQSQMTGAWGSGGSGELWASSSGSSFVAAAIGSINLTIGGTTYNLLRKL